MEQEILLSSVARSRDFSGVVISAALALLGVFGFSLAAAQAGPAYKIVVLDVLPSGVDSFAFGLNDAGLVVGASRQDRSGRISQSQPATWEASQPRELWNGLPGGSLQGVNNVGGYVGRYGSSSAAVLPGPGVPFGRAFYWSEATDLIDIGLEPLGNSQAVAVNDSGWVAGTSERFELVDAGGGEIVPAYVPHAFVWNSEGSVRALGDLDGGDSFARGMNSHGQVVGYGDLANGEWGAFVWDESNGMQQLPAPHPGSVQALAINDHGLVLTGGNAVGGSAIWDIGAGVWREAPIGAIDLNNHGQVVGTAGIGGAYLWEESLGVRLLSELVTLQSGWSLDYAAAVNEAGQIVGYGVFDGALRGYLISPVPEPRSLQLAVWMLVFFIVAKRKVAHLIVKGVGRWVANHDLERGLIGKA